MSTYEGCVVTIHLLHKPHERYILRHTLDDGRVWAGQYTLNYNCVAPRDHGSAILSLLKSLGLGVTTLSTWQVVVELGEGVVDMWGLAVNPYLPFKVVFRRAKGV